MSAKKEIEVDETGLSYVDDSAIGEYDTEEEEFEDLYGVGVLPTGFADLTERAAYVKWLEANKERLIARYGRLNSYFS